MTAKYIKRDPYQRDFPIKALPERTPFSRSLDGDKGSLFFYRTNSRLWGLIMEANDLSKAFASIPVGYRDQFWLFEKVYSTKKTRRKLKPSHKELTFVFSTNYPEGIKRRDWPGRLYIVLREPYEFPTKDGDVLGYYLDKEEAVNTAKVYTRLKNRRAVVGLLRVDFTMY